jgi:hypothetical protein
MARPKAVVREIAATTRATPLALAPLIQPYRKLGKVSLRVERMQRFARLSAGRNNGDGSWSLASDELDDLEYLCTESTPKEHALSIRVVALDNGDTLAVLNYPLSDSPEHAHESRGDADHASAANDQTHALKGPEDSKALKAVLAEREAEFAELRKTIQDAEAEIARKVAAAVGTARDSWKTELEQHLQTVRTSSEAESSRNAWLAEQLTHLADAKERAERQFAETQDRIRREAEEARSKAEAAWKSAEAERFAKTEAEWRDRSANALAEATARCERAEKALANASAQAEAAIKRDEREQTRAAQDLAGARATLAEREADLAKLKVSLGQIDAELPKKIASALAQAREGWKAEHEQTLAAAQARFAGELEQKQKTWLANQNALLAETKAQATDQLVGKLEQDRKAWLADQNLLLADAKAQTANQLAREFEQARKTWLADQSVLLAEAKKQAADQLSGELQQARKTWLTDQSALLAETKKQAGDQLASAREHWLRESEEARAKAEAAWKSAEAERLSKTEAEWREQSAKLATDLKARCEKAERALADASARAEASASPDAREQARLAAELSSAQSELAERNAELAEAKNAIARSEATLSGTIATAISAAREDWKTELQQRLTEDRNASQAAHDSGLEDAKKRASEQLSAARDEWKAELQQRLEEGRNTWQAAQDSRLEDAKKRASEQLAESREEWKVELQQRLTEGRNAWQAAQESLLEDVKNRAGEQLAEARERWRRDEDETRAKAEASWKDAEAARFAKAEAEWSRNSQNSVAEFEARCRRAEAALAKAQAETGLSALSGADKVEHAKLIEELAEARVALADREAELVHTRSATEQTLERVRHESEMALSKARSDWNDAETARAAAAEAAWGKQSLEALARAEEHWRKNSDETLAAATARFEHSESELAKLHAETETEGGQDGEGVARRLRDKIAVLQATLAVRERELAHARLTAETRISPSRPKTFQQQEESERAPLRRPIAQPAPKSKIPRDVFIVGLLAATVVVQLPRLEGYIPESAWNMIGMTTHPELYKEAAPAKPQQPGTDQTSAQPTTTITRGVNVRSGPTKDGDLVGALVRGAKVTVIAHHGNWTQVRFGDDMSKMKQGWVYNSFLNSPTGDTVNLAPAKK